MRWRIRTGAGVGLAGAAFPALALLLTTPACTRPAEEQALDLLAFSQRDVASVALNEELLFYFSADLDRTSITTGSVRVIDERGGEVPGSRVVRGNALSFLPELPRLPELTDGGLQPGMLYRVVLGGFPRPDGIRSRSGALLSATMMLSFRTAERGSPGLFVDPFFEPSPLVPRGEHRRQEVVVAEGRIELECGEALDPLSVGPQGFDLLRFPEGAGADELEPVPVPFGVRLVENRRERALLEIEPADRPAFEDGEYYLSLGEHGPRTLGGRRVEAGWPGVLTVTVPPRLEIDLASPQGGATEVPPGCDGTALWTERGLTIRYPAAAGSGVEGNIELTAPPSASDVHATRLVVPRGTALALGGRQGPIVLRSQGMLEVAGKLSRIGSVFNSRVEPLTLELHAAVNRAPSEWGKLGPWVERLLKPDAPWSRQPWTVLIAGGDLVVPRDGEIDVDGPLLLAAGGWIRVEGSVRASEVWRTPESGGNIGGKGLQVMPLVLEPPTVNPLRETLRFGALFPLPRLPGSWATVLESEGELGQWNVEFLEQRDGSLAAGGPATDPARPSGHGARAFIEFRVPAGSGEPWDPVCLRRFEFKPIPEVEESPRRP